MFVFLADQQALYGSRKRVRDHQKNQLGMLLLDYLSVGLDPEVNYFHSKSDS